MIKSVSGIRGTIGGAPGENLTPVDIIAFTSAYGSWLLEQTADRPSVVIGRDGRISGKHVQALVQETLCALGIDVIDVGLSTTPTVEMYVPHTGAAGGIIITASHNPRAWNALKFLNADGEFISAAVGASILDMARRASFRYATIDQVGTHQRAKDALEHHVQSILDLDLVNAARVRAAGYHVVVDCINSTGAIAIPALLDALGCTWTLINDEINGQFAHNPEPLPAHLHSLMQTVVDEQAQLGIAVDPDVDRLALVAEDGSYFGEEYTLVAVADHVLAHTPGPTVSNLSSTQALRDITVRAGQAYTASPVGEVHVVQQMKESKAVIGGEGNGGIIYPALHYGRDALVGIALVLTMLAERRTSLSELRATYPQYVISKNKINLEKGVDPDDVLSLVRRHYREAQTDTRDGLKILLAGEWIHLRKSNTEPVIRIYTESTSEERADQLAAEVLALITTSV